MSHRRYTYLVKEDILLLKRRYTSFLKETHRTFAHSGMGGLLLWLLILTACVGEELQKPLLGEGEGYLRLQVAPVSAEITTSPLTKAEIPTEQIPKPNQCAIKITNKSTDKSTSYTNSDALPNPLVLKAGVTYTVEAYHGENNTLQETPYFHGSSEVTIQPNKNNDATINVVFANAMLVPEVDQNLAKHYSTWKLTASTSDKSLTFAEKDKTSTSQKTLYAKADEAVTFTFSGKNLAEKEVSSSWDKTFEAGFAYQLQCNPDLTAFEKIKVKATAEHTYDNYNGYLTGTNITSFSADLNEADLAAIKTWQVDVHYNNQIIRTYTGKSLSNMSYTDTGWPYIPQGSTLSASVTLKSEDEISNLKGTFTSLPTPDFGITVTDAQTSYSVYTTSGAAAANEKDGSSIFDITSSVSISQEILNKYPELLSNVTYSEDLNSATTSAKLGATASLSNLSWARHQLTASVTFDNTTKTTSSAYLCDVTGLPYTADFDAVRDQQNWLGWTQNGAKWHKTTWGYYKLVLNGGFIVSPKFHITEDLPISINAGLQAYLSKSTFTIGSTSSTSMKASSDTYTQTVSSTVTTGQNITNKTFSSLFRVEKSYLSITGSIDNSIVYSVSITYR